MRRSLLPLLAGAAVLAACGRGPTDAAPTGAPPSSSAAATSAPTGAPSGGPPSSGGPSSGTTTPAPPFRPTSASVTTARWRLPFAAARQAAVALGGARVLLAGGLVAGDGSTGQVVRVDLARGTTTLLRPLAVPVHDVAGGLAGGTPLVVGGGNATEQDVVQAGRARSWQVVGHLPTTRSDLSVVQRGRTPWAVGGYDGTSTPTTVLALAADGSSRPVGALAHGVRYAATAVAGHTAYVFGGEVLGQELGDVQALDLRTGRTRVVAHLPVPLGHAMAAVFGDRVLLVGGRVSPDRQTAAMWWFDPATGGFRPAGRLPHPLSDAAVGTAGRRLWLLGGEDPAVTDRVLTISVR